MPTWIRDENGDWSEDRPDTPEIYRDEQEREEQLRRELEEEFRRRHEPQPGLQIIPTEREEENPRTPTPAQIQNIIDDLDEEDTTPQPPKPRTPYLH